MISLIVDETDFDIVSKNLWDESRLDAGQDLTETDLHYTLFPSRVTFEINGTVVIGPRRRVPLFDFMACAVRLVRALRFSETTSMGFTEAADRIHFRPVTGDVVEISASEPDLLIDIDRLELVAALEDFVSRGRELLADNVPGIQRNPHFVKLFV